MTALLIVLLLISPFLYPAFFRRSLRIEIDGFSLYRGVLRGHKYSFREVNSIQLDRRERKRRVYHVLLVEIGEKRFIAGDEDDFASLKTALEGRCRVVKEDEAMAASLWISESYGRYPEPIGRKYFCLWS